MSEPGSPPGTVDEFVRARVLPDLQPVVALVRELMDGLAPDAREAIGYGIPSYQGRKIFAVISPTKKDITLSFTHGSEFIDNYGLLKGRGKVSRHVKLKSPSSVNREAQGDYIRQALEIDAKRNA